MVRETIFGSVCGSSDAACPTDGAGAGAECGNTELLPEKGARARSYRAHSPYHHTTSTRVSCGGEGRGVTAAHFACSR